MPKEGVDVWGAAFEIRIGIQPMGRSANGAMERASSGPYHYVLFAKDSRGSQIKARGRWLGVLRGKRWISSPTAWSPHQQAFEWEGDGVSGP